MAFRTNKMPVLQTKSASGSVATFNTALAMPLKSCVSDITGYQEGTGTPSPSNVRPLHAFSSGSLGKCDNNTASLWTIDNSFNGDVEFNQLVAISSSNVSKTQNNVTITDNRDGSYTVSTTAEGASADTYIAVGNFRKYANHIYCMTGCPSGGSSSTYNWYISGINSSNQDKGNGAVERVIESGTAYIVPVYIKSGTIITTPITFKPVCIDFTQMFGSTIADYIYNLETQTAGAGVAFFKTLYPDDYYSYNTGTKQLVGDTLATFTFGQSIYQGYIDWKRGVVTTSMGVRVFDGSSDETWRTYSGQRYTAPVSDFTSPSNSQLANIICDKLETITKAQQGSKTFVISSSDADSHDFMVNVGANSYNDMIDWLNANPITVAYELATPIEIPLGGINLLTQEGVNNIFCDTGDIDLTYKDLDIAKRGSFREVFKLPS